MYYVDLHIHIGRTSSGKPVKITGSKSLTIENILKEAVHIKGMDMIGVIDCHVPEVLMEIQKLKEQGEVYELEGGGLRFKDVTLILGSEIEVYDEYCHGPIHVLAYLPSMETMIDFSRWLETRMKNITLSSQRIYESAQNLQKKVKELGGLFIPAHVFTPYKSLYGKGVRHSLLEVLNPDLIDAIELGLSSNTEMADQISELHRFPFLSNSDAHSLPKIAREYQVISMQSPTFSELALALQGRKDRQIIANYGLDPLLGKYHRTVCETCSEILKDGKTCPHCGTDKVIKGVFERLKELKDTNERKKDRPPYIHQVPLEFIPKVGSKTLMKMRNHFGTEMNILHKVPIVALEEVVGTTIAQKIGKAREGKLQIASGGGGKYGKVTPN